jgi:hypothetical protein
MKYIIFYLIILFGCTACFRSHSGGYGHMDSTYDKRISHDSSYFKRIIAELSDSTKDDHNFFFNLGKIGRAYGFYFGLREAMDSGWKSEKAAYRFVYRKNVSTVYNEYQNSCIFMRPLDSDSTRFIRYEIDVDLGERLLQQSELEKIKAGMQKLCNADTVSILAHED